MDNPIPAITISSVESGNPSPVDNWMYRFAAVFAAEIAGDSPQPPKSLQASARIVNPTTPNISSPAIVVETTTSTTVPTRDLLLSVPASPNIPEATQDDINVVTTPSQQNITRRKPKRRLNGVTASRRNYSRLASSGSSSTRYTAKANRGPSFPRRSRGFADQARSTPRLMDGNWRSGAKTDNYNVERQTVLGDETGQASFEPLTVDSTTQTDDDAGSSVGPCDTSKSGGFGNIYAKCDSAVNSRSSIVMRLCAFTAAAVGATTIRMGFGIGNKRLVTLGGTMGFLLGVMSPLAFKMTSRAS